MKRRGSWVSLADGLSITGSSSSSISSSSRRRQTAVQCSQPRPGRGTMWRSAIIKRVAQKGQADPVTRNKQSANIPVAGFSALLCFLVCMYEACVYAL